MPEEAVITFNITKDSFTVTAAMPGGDLEPRTFELAGDKEIVGPVASTLGTLLIACALRMVPEVEVAA